MSEIDNAVLEMVCVSLAVADHIYNIYSLSRSQPEATPQSFFYVNRGEVEPHMLGEALPSLEVAARVAASPQLSDVSLISCDPSSHLFSELSGTRDSSPSPCSCE
jgi:hypothetical protein